MNPILVEIKLYFSALPFGEIIAKIESPEFLNNSLNQKSVKFSK
jgi:hypothetical protein